MADAADAYGVNVAPHNFIGMLSLERAAVMRVAALSEAAASKPWVT